MNIYEKLVEVRKSVDYLKKENKGFNYQFVSSSQALASIRKKMNELGVMLIPEITSHKITETKNQKGNTEFLTELEVMFRWVNTEKPSDFIEIKWYGQGIDNGEKGVGKALTYGEKYLILKTFNIPTDKDDPDAFQQKHSDQCNADTQSAISTENAKDIARLCMEIYSLDKKNILKLVTDIVGRGITKATDLTVTEGGVVLAVLKNPTVAYTFVSKYQPKEAKEAA